MADFAPPPGPPPPKVPEGWKAVWNEQYHEWFFVNLYTKQSTWEKPTEPVYPAGEAPLPPAYGGATPSHPTGTSEKSTFSSNNPYSNQQPGISEDERLARKLQEEEEAQARAGRRSGDTNHGTSNDYYNHPQGSHGATGPSVYGAPQSGGYPQPGGYSHQQYQAPSTPYQDDKSQSKGKGLLGKLLGKSSHGSSSHHAPQAYGQPAYAGGAGYYGGQGMYQQRPGYAMPVGGRPGGGGMGMGGMAMGAGAGLLGGAMLGSALGDAGDHGDTYIENNYGDDGGDMGGDGGGFDDGGGDF